MGKGTEDSSGGGIPGNGPVSMRLDGFGWFCSANGEVKIPDGGGDLVFGETGEKSREDSIKVDHCAGKYMFPLGV
jgi:hypothetical protein